MLTYSRPFSWVELGLAFFAICGGLYILWRRLLPKPIPGIPYNENALKTIWGDSPAMVRYSGETREIWGWITSQIRAHNSPIVQLFARPFGNPWVLVSDFQESQDILLRRTKEFDRSQFFGDIFAGTMPDNHLPKSSSDPQFKRNRALLKDLMTPAFLNDVVASSIYSTVEALLDVWKLKMTLGQGHPFEADEDLYRAALDAIFAATFSFDAREGTTAAQAVQLSARPPTSIPSDPEEPVHFAIAEAPAQFESILKISDAFEVIIKAPFPRLGHMFIRQFPWYRRAFRNKERMIENQIQAGVKRFQSQAKTYRKTCALDEILQREFNLAKKEERAPDYHSRMIKDELFGFLLGGHDTTSTYLTWSFKFLSDNPQVQQKLRSQLRNSLATASTEHRNPTAQEIATSHLPYLEAVMEETMRMGGGIAAISRVTLQDTVILGHVIPKGHDVLLLSNGPGYREPRMHIDDHLRSESSRKARQAGTWDDTDNNDFLPERWLATDEEGQVVFDATSGPMLAFGLGPRGCYGRRLAYLEMRLMLTLVVWNFKLDRCREDLSSYKGVDKLLHKPEKCFLKLRPAVW